MASSLQCSDQDSLVSLVENLVQKFAEVDEKLNSIQRSCNRLRIALRTLNRWFAMEKGSRAQVIATIDMNVTALIVTLKSSDFDQYLLTSQP